MTPTAFITMLLSAARDCQRKSGIPASFTLAQAALESGWGERALGNNLFGIKADKSWRGPTVSFRTQEHLEGKDIHINDKFRAYTSWDECLADRAAFFKDNPRYANCFKESTGEGWARAVALAGYATDPGYAQKLIDIMRGRGMAKYDIPAEVRP